MASLAPHASQQAHAFRPGAVGEEIMGMRSLNIRKPRAAVACSAAAGSAGLPAASPPPSKLERLADFLTLLFPVWVSALVDCR